MAAYFLRHLNICWADLTLGGKPADLRRHGRFFCEGRLDVCGRCYRQKRTFPGVNVAGRTWSENVQLSARNRLLLIAERYDYRLACLCACWAVARYGIRRQILYRRERQRSVLPSDLPGADRERKKC